MDNVVLVSLPCLVILLISTQEASSDSFNCFNDYCFTYSGSDVNRSVDEARTWCANNNSSSLAGVSNKPSQDALYTFLSSSEISSPIYVNAKLGLNQGRDSTWYLFSGEKFPGEVKNQSMDRDSKYEFYTSLRIWSQTFAIFASSPQESMNYICSYRNLDGKLPPSTNYSYNGAVYIKYENETLNWFDARNRCYLNGGDLATFHDLNDFSTSWLNLSISYWIGIRWMNWQWENMDDHQEVIYTRWSVGKPNVYTLGCICADAMYSWNWTDCDCSTQRPFVCATYRGASTTTSPSIAPNAPTLSQSNTSVSKTPKNTLAIGIGVGVGGGILIILVIVVIIIVVKKRKRAGTVEGKPRKEPKESKKSTETPVKQPTANTAEYAEILAASQPGPRGSAKKPVVYTTPEFVETK